MVSAKNLTFVEQLSTRDSDTLKDELKENNSLSALHPARLEINGQAQL